MNDSTWLFLGTALTIVIGGLVTVYNSRNSSPQIQATLVEAADGLITQFQIRLAALELRVGHLESENDAYHRLYGPLPLIDRRTHPRE